MKVIFLDVETTGTEEEDRLCQLAYKTEEEEVDLLFNPLRPMSIGAMSVCHITDSMLDGKETFKDSTVSKRLCEILKDHIFVAHNAVFDMEFLEKRV